MPSIIIITSNEPWGKVWVSKHHYANELSKLGYLVYFLNAPTHWNPINLFSFSVKTTKINEKLFVLDYKNNFPLKIFKRFFLKINDFINSWKISKVVKETKNTFWWQFDPFRFVNIYFFQNTKRIYHVVDPYKHIWSDREIAKKADVVVSLLKEYNDYYLPYNKNIINIPHGISSTEFRTDEEVVKKIKENYNNFILLTGTIADDTNIALLDFISNRLNNKILLVGPNKIESKNKIEAFENLIKKNNVHWLGQKKSGDLKNYVKASSVCIVPYDFTGKELRASSLKIINYLAQHKITITSKATGFESLIDKGIFLAKDLEEFITLISRGLNKELFIDNYAINSYLDSINYISLIDKIIMNTYEP